MILDVVLVLVLIPTATPSVDVCQHVYTPSLCTTSTPSTQYTVRERRVLLHPLVLYMYRQRKEYTSCSRSYYYSFISNDEDDVVAITTLTEYVLATREYALYYIHVVVVMVYHVHHTYSILHTLHQQSTDTLLVLVDVVALFIHQRVCSCAEIQHTPSSRVGVASHLLLLLLPLYREKSILYNIEDVVEYTTLLVLLV